VRNCEHSCEAQLQLRGTTTAKTLQGNNNCKELQGNDVCEELRGNILEALPGNICEGAAGQQPLRRSCGATTPARICTATAAKELQGNDVCEGAARHNCEALQGNSCEGCKAQL
jgi:hypothetical protein